MAKTVALLLGVHAHQPVGNFEFVLDDAHVRCYGPFLRVLHQYPEFKFAIHISGWLLEYLFNHYPEDMDLLKEMVQRGQTELFGAGFTEPVLAAIPALDRVGQITQLSSFLQQHLGEIPHGAWLTERVWESTVVPALVKAGIQYVTVDDYHFMCTGKARVLDGYYTTEEDNFHIDLFPISEALRYRMPFSPADETVGYLESLADDSKQAAAIYFDDIEKFGIWPETYEWVYERGWLRNFIEGVLNSEIVKPMRYSDYHAMAKTRGIVYLPTASYIEMNEWTLPVPAAHHYADLVDQEKYADRYEQNKPYIRGGIWRNFFMRYPESNWMHKRMLSLSSRYHALPDSRKTADMLKALYEAQANDAYWHGLFGGLYLPHLRRAIYNAILTLEVLLDAITPRPLKTLMDLDLDGCTEAFLQNGEIQAVARLDGSASICEFDSYKLRHNFGDTFTRQTEHYHRKVNAQPDLSQASSSDGIANPHERMSSKHEIEQADLAVDEYRKTLFNDFWIDSDSNSERLCYRPPASGKSTLEFITALEGSGVRGSKIQKKIGLDSSSLIVSYEFAQLPEGTFKIEINLAMPSCDGPAGFFRVGKNIHGGFGQALELENLKHLELEDAVLGGVVHIRTNVACTLTSHPHFSVSQSEAGFEKIMQAVTLELQWSAQALKGGLQVKVKIV